MRTVARAEPTTPVTGTNGGDATEVCANTDENEPLRLLHTHEIGLGVTERSGIVLLGLGDLLLSSVADENGLTTPLDSDGLTLGDGRQVDLDLRQGEHKTHNFRSSPR